MLIEAILDGKFTDATASVHEKLEQIKERRLIEAKQIYAAAAYTLDEEYEIEELEEGARVKIVKARIRNGKVQRRKKVSNVKGYTLRGGKMARMSAVERRNRKMGARKGKVKRKAKMNQAIRKRARSLRKRQAMGL